MGRPHHHGQRVGGIGTERGLRMELIEAPSFEDYFQADKKFVGEQFCTGQVQNVYIRKGQPAKLIAIGTMCQDCYAFWPKGFDYKKMPVRKET